MDGSDGDATNEAESSRWNEAKGWSRARSSDGLQEVMGDVCGFCANDGRLDGSWTSMDSDTRNEKHAALQKKQS